MDVNEAVWRKSSRSGGSGGDCVELAALAGSVAIRDSKNPAGGHLAVPRTALAALIQRIKVGDLAL